MGAHAGLGVGRHSYVPHVCPWMSVPCPSGFQLLLSPWIVTCVSNYGCNFRGRSGWGTCPHLPPSLGRRRLCLRSVAHSSSVAQEASRGRGLSGCLRNDREVVSKDGLAARPLPADKEQDLPSQARRTDTGPRGLAGGSDAGEAVGVRGQRGERPLAVSPLGVLLPREGLAVGRGPGDPAPWLGHGARTSLKPPWASPAFPRQAACTRGFPVCSPH